MKNWKTSTWSVRLVLLAMACSIGNRANATAEGKVTNQSVRTYMNFAKDVDPAHILTMADLELSIALSSPLVVFNSERQVVSGLAETWEILPPNKVSFKLRKNLRWSDGTSVTAAEYKLALERAKRLYSNDLKALFETVARIDAPNESTLIFETVGPASESGLLLKLTEPMYGLVALKGGKLNLAKTVGPFVVAEKTETQLTLKVNKNWYSYTSAMPSVVEIRLPKDGVDLTANFDKDEWPNLTSGSSLMSKDTSDRFKKMGYKTWQRSLDKVFSLYPSKRFLENDGANFVKMLSQKIDCNVLLKGLSGYTAADQFFPRGYELFSSHAPRLTSVDKWNGKGPITLLFIDNPSLAGMREELVKLISKISGQTTKVELIPLSKADERMKLGDFDLFGVQIAVADPNFEGAMSFFIERDPPFIQSGKGKSDFSKELRAARGLPTSTDRAERMREIMISAQESGHVLPLFHFSSLAIAKPGIDISEVPNSDETILFSKVRIK